MVIKLLHLKLTHTNIDALGIILKAFPFSSDSFFPQMKPEKWSSSAEASADKRPELTENEKLIFDILEKEKSMDLNALKEQAGLSNKQWDKGMKGLAKHGLTKVTKTEDSLIVDLVG